MVDRALLAGGGAHELLLEAGDEAARSRARPSGRGPRRPRTARRRGCRRSRSTTKSPLAAGALGRLELARCARAGARPRRRSASSVTSARRRPTSRPLYVAEHRHRAHADLDREASAARPRRAGRRGRGRARRPARCWRRRSRPSTRRRATPRTASSSTASRPTRLMITGGGTLPLRKPGTRRSRPSARGRLARGAARPPPAGPRPRRGRATRAAR